MVQDIRPAESCAQDLSGSACYIQPQPKNHSQVGGSRVRGVSKPESKCLRESGVCTTILTLYSQTITPFAPA